MKAVTFSETTDNRGKKNTDPLTTIDRKKIIIGF